MRRHRHAVAFLDGDNGGADLRDDAEGLVADDHTGHVTHAPLIDVQVRPADGRGGDTQEDVGGRLDARVLDGLDGDLVHAADHDSSHGSALSYATGRWTGRATARRT